VPVFLVKYPANKSHTNHRKSTVDSLYLCTAQKDDDLKLTDSDSTSFDGNNSSTSNEEPKAKTAPLPVQQAVHKNEIKLNITSSATMKEQSSQQGDINMPESLPLVESYDLSNQKAEPKTDKDEDGFGIDDIRDLEDLLKVADRKISNLTSIGQQELNDTNSISSIEGSLKGRSSNSAAEEGSEGLGSSTPLLHLYSKMGK
jgi:hypothetical protein